MVPAFEDYRGLTVGLTRPELENIADSEHPRGQFYSWNIISDKVALKAGDKYFFNHHGSGIPKEIRWFFGAENLAYGDKDIDIILLYEGKPFSGRLITEAQGRCRIIWHSDLSHLFRGYYHVDPEKYPLIRFEKKNANEYIVEFID